MMIAAILVALPGCGTADLPDNEGAPILSVEARFIAGDHGTASFGGTASCAGDVNGDGFDDLIVALTRRRRLVGAPG